MLRTGAGPLLEEVPCGGAEEITLRLYCLIAGGGGDLRAWRLGLLTLAGLLAAAASTVLAVALNVATGGTARWFLPVERHPLWWTAGATVTVAGAGLLTWWAQRWYDRGLAELIPAVQPFERGWWTGRPRSQVVAALRPRGDGRDHHGGAGGGRVREDYGREDGAR